MSQYFCSIVDNALCNPAQRMYFDLGEYRYGLTIVGDGEPIVCLHRQLQSSRSGIHPNQSTCVELDYTKHYLQYCKNTDS